jgi:hypothetical protein
MGVMKTADGTQSQEAVNELVPVRGSRYGDQYSMGHGDTVVATLISENIAADQGFILVDLTDTANFPHTETGKIRLYSLTIDVQTDTSGDFIIYIGTIIEVDATDGSTTWLLGLLCQWDDNPTDGTAHRQYFFNWEKGLDLEVSGGAMVNVISNAGDAADVVWQTDVNLDSPVGAASSPSGTGDLCMFADRTAGNLDISVTVEYITEGV